MSIVTGLRADARAPGNVVVEIDGRRYGSLPVERVRALGLAGGTTLDDFHLEALAAAAAEESAIRAAVAALARRPRAGADLARWLMRRGHPPPAARRAVERLAERGILDDRAFARHYTAQRLRRGHGPARLLRDLLALGVDRAVADEALREARDAEGVNPSVEAERLARRRLAQIERLPPKVQRRRLVAFLGRRGHDGAVVRRIVEALVPRP